MATPQSSSAALAGSGATVIVPFTENCDVFQVSPPPSVGRFTGSKLPVTVPASMRSKLSPAAGVKPP